MGFPEIIAVGAVNTGVDTVAVSVPAHEAGDRILVLTAYFTLNGSSDASSIGTFDGQAFTVVGNIYPAYGCRLYAWEIVSRGAAHAGGSVTVSGNTYYERASFAVVVRGTGPESAEIVAGSSGNNPPSLTPSWGSGQTLWLALWHGLGTSGLSVTAPPAGYTDLTLAGKPSDSNAGWLAWARRNLEADTEDPGAFTGSAPSHNGSSTIAIPGISGPSLIPVRPLAVPIRSA